MGGSQRAPRHSEGGPGERAFSILPGSAAGGAAGSAARHAPDTPAQVHGVLAHRQRSVQAAAWHQRHRQHHKRALHQAWLAKVGGSLWSSAVRDVIHPAGVLPHASQPGCSQLQAGRVP